MKISINNNFFEVNNFLNAKLFIQDNGVPSYIYFSLDEKNELEISQFVEWLILEDKTNSISIPKNFSFNVDCICLLRKNRIESRLNNYLFFGINDY